VQFHDNGFQVGNPEIRPADPSSANRARALPGEVDVLIVGCGPAGLVLAAQLAAFPHISTRIVERRPGPLELGQADGISCRSVEMFDAFGFSERLVKEAYWVNETVFWRPDEADRSRVVRTGRIQDVQDDLSEFPHLIVNQARIHDYLLENMRNSPSRLEPDYGLAAVGVEVAGSAGHPVTVTLRRVQGEQLGDEVKIRARYVVGADGARSSIRQSMGRQLRGDSANHLWGVMDILAVTDFPDIRLKAAIQSGNGGSILLIPREGGFLVRLYVDLGDVDPALVAERKRMSAEEVIEAARRVLHPYKLEVKDIAWFSIYEVAQRVTDKFDDVPVDPMGSRTPRVFIAGDACHTHSAKAGQGMNVSMQDTFNLGWKLAAVLEGRSDASLLHTYSAERQTIAQYLIDFDKEWSAIMAAGPRDPANPARGGVDPSVLQENFVRGGRFTAGVATRYSPSLLTGEATWQGLATGFTVGTRFHSAPVVRLADAKPLQLGHVAEADGRWRLYAFVDDAASGAKAPKIHALCDYLEGNGNSPVRRFTPKGADIDKVFDLRAVFQGYHRDLRIEDLPSLLLPKKGRFGLVDYEKSFATDRRAGDIFDLRGIDRSQGCLVVVRPDQYIAQVLPLDAFAELDAFFSAFMLVPA
jgi:phenol 2-monooxygenase